MKLPVKKLKTDLIAGILVERGLATDTRHARTLLNCGLVYVGDKCLGPKSVLTAGELDKYGIRVKHSKEYVSRGAVKLDSVFEKLELRIDGFRCMDIGASTGGFTDLLLKKGAECVYAIDVGQGLLDYKIRTDPRVIVMENINARYLGEYAIVQENIRHESVDLAVWDLSFISLDKAIAPVLPYLKKDAYLIPLVKPQFEVPREYVEKGGIVRDENAVRDVLDKYRDYFTSLGLNFLGEIPSGLKGSSGNQEYFLVYKSYQL
jgi:23S rRNA (cytidine1920-2'-O)/16S rRNA (cytidine1409-2'-O)-methyltransferase